MATTRELNEQEQSSQLYAAAPLLQAFIECSDKLQVHAKKMLAVMLDSHADPENRDLAACTLADILFPNMHEGDKKLGIDLADAEVMAKGHVESREALDAMDLEEETFANRLGAAMQAADLTQTALARRVGVGQSAISMMLNRQCRPQKRTVTRVAEALGVSPDALWPGHTTARQG